MTAQKTNVSVASWVSKCLMFLICWMLSIAIWHLNVIWCLKLSSLSSRTPRYLIITATLTSMLLMFSDVVMHLSSWGFELKRMNLVLSLFILSQFLTIHIFRSTAHFPNSCMHLTSSSQCPAFNLSLTMWSSVNHVNWEADLLLLVLCCSINWRLVLLHRTLEVHWREDFVLMSILFQC